MKVGDIMTIDFEKIQNEVKQEIENFFSEKSSNEFSKIAKLVQINSLKITLSVLKKYHEQIEKENL